MDCHLYSHLCYFVPIIHRETGVQAECPTHWAAADPLEKQYAIEVAWVSCRDRLDLKAKAAPHILNNNLNNNLRVIKD